MKVTIRKPAPRGATAHRMCVSVFGSKTPAVCIIASSFREAERIAGEDLSLSPGQLYAFHAEDQSRDEESPGH